MDYKIIIDNSQNNNTLTDYQVKVKITDPAFFSKCTEQKFVEFYDEDKQTLLNHWTEKFDKANNIAIFWVKVPNIPANGTKTIYLKINTSRTEDLSNPENVFDLWDDFEGNSLDTTKWEVLSGVTVSVSNSVLRITNDGAEFGVKSKITFSNYAIHGKVRTGGTSDCDEWFIAIAWKDGSNHYKHRHNPKHPDSKKRHCIYKIVGGSETIIVYVNYTTADTNWHKFVAKVLDSGKKAIEFEDLPDLETTDTELTSPFNICLGGTTCSGHYAEFDYIFVRKYTEPEPTVSVVPIVATPTLEFKKRVAECIVTENCKINEADPKLELYDSGGNLIKTLSLADKHIFKDETNNRVVVQFLFVDDSSDSYTSESQKLKFTKGGAEYVAFEASETLEKSADEPLPLRWEIYIPYTLDIELEGEY